MTDHPFQPSDPASGQEPAPPAYTPASFEKRTAAWVGVAYMILIVLATTYMIATAQVLSGTAPLLLVPGAAGVAVTAVHRCRQSPSRTGLLLTICLSALCILACGLGLLWGLPSLLAHLEALL